MDAYEAVKTWVYSGGDALAPLTFRKASDSALAAALAADWPIWSQKASAPIRLMSLKRDSLNFAGKSDKLAASHFLRTLGGHGVAPFFAPAGA